MKLMVIVLCLLSERYMLHAISFQRFAWFGIYFLSIKKYTDQNNFFTNPWIILAATIVPLVAITAFIYFIFHNILFGIMGFFLNLFIFLYCLGPQNIFYPVAVSDDSAAEYFAQANSQLFAVIFWYIIGGPIVLLAYRLITLCKNIDSISTQATQISNILEWLPARITSIMYLVVGNFQRAIPAFIQLFMSHPELNDNLLSQCGLLAVRNEEGTVPLSAAETLVEHATFVLLVLIALFTLVAWL